MRRIANRVLISVEALLWLAFIADCFLLLAGSPRLGNSYDLSGGLSLVVILIATAIVRRLRGAEMPPG